MTIPLNHHEKSPLSSHASFTIGFRQGPGAVLSDHLQRLRAAHGGRAPVMSAGEDDEMMGKKLGNVGFSMVKSWLDLGYAGFFHVRSIDISKLTIT